MDNRRAFARFAVRIADELMRGSGAPGAVCTIIDLSEGGARVDADTTGQPARRAPMEQHALHVAPQATKRPDRTRDAFR